MLTILNIISSLLDSFTDAANLPIWPKLKCVRPLDNGPKHSDPSSNGHIPAAGGNYSATIDLIGQKSADDQNSVSNNSVVDPFDGLAVTALEVSFSDAAERVKCLAKTLDSTTLLRLYALYKVANDGPCRESGDDPRPVRPPIWDVKGRQKFDAWMALGTMDKEAAMAQYIELVHSLLPAQEDSSIPSIIGDVRGQSATGLGVGVSRPIIDDPLTSHSGTVDLEDPLVAAGERLLDDAKEGNLAAFKDDLSSDLLRYRDSRGLTLLHWAVDRGHQSIADRLIHLALAIPDGDWSIPSSPGCASSQTAFVDWLVNARDYDGQSSLHYAVGSERSDIVKLLIDAGANLHIKDIDGFVPRDLCETEEFSEFFDECVDKREGVSENASVG